MQLQRLFYQGSSEHTRSGLSPISRLLSRAALFDQSAVQPTSFGTKLEPGIVLLCLMVQATGREIFREAAFKPLRAETGCTSHRLNLHSCHTVRSPSTVPSARLSKAKLRLAHSTPATLSAHKRASTTTDIAGERFANPASDEPVFKPLSLERHFNRYTLDRSSIQP